MSERLGNGPIGIIGLGDFGSRLATQQLLSGNEVRAFDSDPCVEYLAKLAIDPGLDTSVIDEPRLRKVTVDDILHECGIVHWAVASSWLEDLPLVPDTCTVVLHDSVMNNSSDALRHRQDSDRFVIAHCLMNEFRRVMVSNEFGNHEEVQEHFRSIGLDPRTTTVEEHDTHMARSQGVFALLIALGIRDELDTAYAAGNLTPSAEELRAAVDHRESNWTDATIKSILGNPELRPFVQEMLATLEQ